MIPTGQKRWCKEWGVHLTISTLGTVAKKLAFCRPPAKMNRTKKLKTKQKKTHAKNSEVDLKQSSPFSPSPFSNPLLVMLTQD